MLGLAPSEQASPERDPSPAVLQALAVGVRLAAGQAFRLGFELSSLGHLGTFRQRLPLHLQPVRPEEAHSSVIAARYTEQAAIRSTANTIDADSVIGGGFNGLSVGPIAVAEGITVTVEPNHTWSIV